MKHSDDYLKGLEAGAKQERAAILEVLKNTNLWDLIIDLDEPEGVRWAWNMDTVCRTKEAVTYLIKQRDGSKTAANCPRRTRTNQRKRAGK